MDTKILIGFFGVLVLILAVPFVLTLMQNQGPNNPIPDKPIVGGITPPSSPPPPPPTTTVSTDELLKDYPITYQEPPRTAAQFERGQASSLPPLTPETLVGTAWEVSSQFGTVIIEIGPNGQAIANHPMVGSIVANWRVQGNKVIATATFMGQTMNIDATIEGNTLKVPGQTIRRLR